MCVRVRVRVCVCVCVYQSLGYPCQSSVAGHQGKHADNRWSLLCSSHPRSHWLSVRDWVTRRAHGEGEEGRERGGGQRQRESRGETECEREREREERGDGEKERGSRKALNIDLAQSF